MINFSALKGLTISEGVVTQIADENGAVLWGANEEKSVPAVLQVEKITSDTYAGETLYEGEQFILLDIYPNNANSTVKVTYGGLTKTLKFSGTNAQQVYFGTFNGVSDDVATPTSGTLTIEGDYVAFGCSSYQEKSKDAIQPRYNGITDVSSMGIVKYIPDYAFSSGGIESCNITTIDIPNSVVRIGRMSLFGCPLPEVTIPKNVSYIGYLAFGMIDGSVLKIVRMLSNTPPEIGIYTDSNGTVQQMPFPETDAELFSIEKITVPKGCGNIYKTAAGWSQFADYIVEEG